MILVVLVVGGHAVELARRLQFQFLTGFAAVDQVNGKQQWELKAVEKLLLKQSSR